MAEETAVAALLLVGKQTAVAAGATMATVAGDGTRVTADEGDGNESNEHGETESENTLHHIPPDENIEREVRSLSRHETTPIRDGHRTAENRASNETTRGTEQHSDNRQLCPARAAGWGKSPTWVIQAIRLTVLPRLSRTPAGETAARRTFFPR